MGAKDYYHILGVQENASQSEIKQRYRELAKQYHPDKNEGDKQAEEKFKSISEAYDVLGDPQKRQKYDQMRKFGGSQGFGFDPSHFSGFQGSPGGINFNGFSFENFSGFGGLGDIFSQFFDLGERTRQKRYGPRSGESIGVEISIPFELSISGGKTSFAIKKEKICPSCQGGGAKPGSRVDTCGQCQGRGTVIIGQGGFGVSRPCPKCYGRGQIIKNPCDTCSGTGQVERNRTYTIRIQPGIENGSQIRLKEQGQPGVSGGKPGDMIVTVRVQPHRFFRRKKNDIHCEVPLSLSQAVLGAKIKVKTVQGNKVQLNVPKGTQDGTTFRLTGLGVENCHTKGDQLVTVRVKIPENLTDEEVELMEEFSRKNKSKK